jgi:hypothetical protein
MPIDLPPIKNALTQLSGHTVIRPKNRTIPNIGALFMKAE